MTPQFFLQVKLTVTGKAHEKLRSGVNDYISMRKSVQPYLGIYTWGYDLKIGRVAGDCEV